MTMQPFDLVGSLPLIVIWLALGAVGIVIQAFVRNTKLVFGYYAGTLAVTGTLAALTSYHKTTAFQHMITVGGYANYFDVLFCAAGLMTMLAARPYLQRSESEYDEFYTLLVSAVSGMILMAHSNNLVVTFVGVELMSISFYVMAGFFKMQERSVEAALKYFLLGAFASGFLVYGMALLYGATGSLDYVDIGLAAHGGTLRFPLLLAAGAVLMTIGLSFKVAAFPFHQWAPDVYEGSPTAVTAFMSTAGKAAAFSAFIPIIMAVMPVGAGAAAAAYAPQLQMVLAIIAAITMLVGNISAIAQTNVKRMLAYSSIAHAGYLMMGLVSGSADGAAGILFYVTSYVFMQIGAFVIVGLVEKADGTNVMLDDYRGLGKRQPLLAGLMAVFMFSLAGIPPFAGFFGKYLLFLSAIEAGFTWLTIVAVVSSVISVYFYLGMVVKMYFQEAEHATEPAPTGMAGITLAVATIAVVVLGVLPSLLLNIYRTW
ncbi:MAG: NADH-quinone oxidoreductase subunit N [Candidatus Kapabacteria bacterium]|nr:NADH-quinone oxidoreductase subunit N [Candidatus Kapabacteria bacterium]